MTVVDLWYILALDWTLCVLWSIFGTREFSKCDSAFLSIRWLVIRVTVFSIIFVAFFMSLKESRLVRSLRCEWVCVCFRLYPEIWPWNRHIFCKILYVYYANKWYYNAATISFLQENDKLWKKNFDVRSLLTYLLEFWNSISSRTVSFHKSHFWRATKWLMHEIYRQVYVLWKTVQRLELS